MLNESDTYWTGNSLPLCMRGRCSTRIFLDFSSKLSEFREKYMMTVVAGYCGVFVILDEGVDHEEGVRVKVIMLLANHVSFVTWKIRDSKPFNRLKHTLALTTPT